MRRVPWLVWLWGPPILEMIAIYTLSATPGIGAPVVGDKVAHLVAYGALAALLIRALAGGRLDGVTGRRVLVGVAAATAYGALDEWHQLHVPTRNADLADLVADCAGAALAGAGAWACGIITRSVDR